MNKHFFANIAPTILESGDTWIPNIGGDGGWRVMGHLGGGGEAVGGASQGLPSQGVCELSLSI